MDTVKNMELKLSRYLVVSEPVMKDKYVIMYSTRSTATRLLALPLYEKLKSGDFSAIDPAIQQELAAMKFLVPQAERELEVVISENKRVISADQTLYTALAPSADCQLGCDYCGQVHTKDKMHDAEHTLIINRSKTKLSKNPQFKHVEIGWFGAEPLTGLKSIYSLSKELSAIAADHHCTYSATMVTNGVALTADIFFRLASECHIRDFEITIDGPREFHDARRHTKKGNPTYAIIMDNILSIVNDDRFKAKPASITLRCNVDARNHSSIGRLIDELDDKGILPKVSFYVAPIHSWGNDAHEETLNAERYGDFEIEIFSQLLKKGQGIGVLPTKQKNIVCMSLKKDAELIDAYGNVYNCSEISQVPSYKEIKIYKIDELHRERVAPVPARPFSDWNDQILAGEVPCHYCNILPVCGGACPKLWKEKISPCPPMKENMPQRLILQMVKLNRQAKH